RCLTGPSPRSTWSSDGSAHSRQIPAGVSTRAYASPASMIRRSVLAVVLVSPLTAPALARRSYTVRVPPFEVPAARNREICVFVPLSSKKAMDIGEVHIRNIGGTPLFATHHLIVYGYHANLASVPALPRNTLDAP